MGARAAAFARGAGLWIFPQGERRPQGERPARFTRGAAQLAIAHGEPVRIVPGGLPLHPFVGEQLPEAFALVGHPRVLEPVRERIAGRSRPRSSATRVATLDALDALLAEEAHGSFRTLVAGRLSVNKRMDRFRHAIGLLRGPFEARNG